MSSTIVRIYLNNDYISSKIHHEKMLHSLALTEGLRLWIARIDADGGISGIFWGFPGRGSTIVRISKFLTRLLRLSTLLILLLVLRNR